MCRIGLCLLSLSMLANVTGCQFFSSRKVNSEWLILEQATTVDCAPWPLGEKDLQINDVKVVMAADPGFVATGVKRDGSTSYFYAPFAGDAELAIEQIRSLQLSRNSVLIGGGMLAGVPVVMDVRNQTRKASLELRTVTDNVIKFSTDLGISEIVEGDLSAGEKGAWLHYRREDQESQLAFIDWTKPGAIQVKEFRSAAFDGPPLVLVKADNTGALAIWRADKGDRRFKLRYLGQGGDVAEPLVLDVKIEGDIESWSAIAFGQGYYLAYIEGDSLIGQATLRLAYFNWREGAPVIQQQSQQAIKDIHVGEPVFAATQAGLELLLLNWVDDESTIARYQVTAGRLDQPRFSGVFERGARLVHGFSGPKGKGLFSLMRYRDDNNWTFKICEL